MSNSERYKIVRAYADKDRPKRVIKRDLTLAEAEAHCSSPESKKEVNGYIIWNEHYYKD